MRCNSIQIPILTSFPLSHPVNTSRYFCTQYFGIAIKRYVRITTFDKIFKQQVLKPLSQNYQYLFIKMCDMGLMLELLFTVYDVKSGWVRTKNCFCQWSLRWQPGALENDIRFVGVTLKLKFNYSKSCTCTCLLSKRKVIKLMRIYGNTRGRSNNTWHSGRGGVQNRQNKCYLVFKWLPLWQIALFSLLSYLKFICLQAIVFFYFPSH